MLPPTKCIIILSSKSSGSSALQNLLTSNQSLHRMAHTRHAENETLYWVKAASVMRLPQIKMVDSEVPIPAIKARKELQILLEKNGVDLSPGLETDDELIFTGWKKLSQLYHPILLEKSPHHIHQWSAIELILEAERRFSELDFYFLGLIRNPMDTLYSMWRRWRSYPEATEKGWIIAYKNLRRLQAQLPSKVHIVRYEDLVSDQNTIADILRFVQTEGDFNFGLHQQSVQKWRQDRRFGFRLSNDAIELAKSFGYSEETMVNQSTLDWPLRRRLSRWQFKTMVQSRKSLRNLIK